MTTVTGEAGAARQPRATRSDLLRQIWISRADYLYVLPAIVVMLVVIAYPIYYTVDLSFFKTPPGLQLRDKIFHRPGQLHRPSSPATCSGASRSTRSSGRWPPPSSPSCWALPWRWRCIATSSGAACCARIFIIPWVISAVAASYIWKWIYHSDFGIIGAVLVQLGLVDRPTELHRQRQHGPGLADRRQRLARVSLRHDHDDGRAADRSRAAPARRAGRRRLGLAALLARHLPASARRVHGHDPAARGGELQLLHHSLDHDRRRPRERLRTSGSPTSTSSPSGASAGAWRRPIR